MAFGSFQNQDEHELAEINMVPLIDVMLVLLVIFMITAPLVNPGQVELPSVGKASNPPVAPLEVALGELAPAAARRLVLLAQGGGPLAEAAPDLILTQELCRVCAVSYREVNAVARTLDADTTVVSLEPTSIEGILNTITTVGAMTEAEDAAIDLVESLKK